MLVGVFLVAHSGISFAKAPVELPKSSKNKTDYQLGPDDVLIINVYGEADLNTGKEGMRVRVSASGSITYPFVGKLYVKDMTVSEVEDKIAEILSDGYIVDPKVTIFCEQNAKVYVFGQVNSPGAYPLITGMTLLSGIAMAGGFTKIAVQSKIKLVRHHGHEKKMYEVRVKDILKGDLTKDIELERNDTIIVMESFF